ncbi:MAG TPA: hypothetical protein VHT75_08785 [Acidimicrobiales bacterium]|jgi:hypothetical protein|nr:hypothetical protein [Acidimicrobiales bacterium]
MPQTVQATRYYIDDEHFCTTRDNDVRWPAMHELVGAEEVEIAGGDAVLDAMHAACEQLFAKYNRGDRPDGRTRRSMSVGDVVVIGESAFLCAARGWRLLPPSGDNIHRLGPTQEEELV